MVAHLLNTACSRNWKLPDQRELDFFVRKLDVEHFAQRRLQIDQRQVQGSLLLPRHDVEDLINAVIILQNELLFVDFHHSLKIDAVVEELHQRLNIWHMRSLEAHILPYKPFGVAQGWRSVEV